MREGLLALIWDFDGTIADTRERNLDVTRSILSSFGKDPDRYEVLKDKDLYTNALLAHSDWRDFYIADLGITPKETENLGKLWGEYQLTSTVEQELYPGVSDVIRFASDLPQGIFSVNSEHTIREFLERHGLSMHFGSIVGYEQLNGAGKPDPEGLLRCIYQLGLLKSEGKILYIGDHKTDMMTAQRGNSLLRNLHKPIQIESIHASYIYGNNLPPEATPDHKAEKPSDIITLLLLYNLQEVVKDFISKNP